MTPLAEHHLSVFLDAAPDAIVIADFAGSIVFINAEAEELFGYSRATLVGHPVEILLPERFRNSHPEHRNGFLTAPRRRPMGDGSQLFARRRDGSEFPAEISLSPVHTENGSFICSAIRDVTERREMETRLIEASREAERANRAKSAFLAAASHDLRQPLQALTLVHGALIRSSPASTAELLEMQAASLDAMSDLLNSLLDISKLEAGVVKPDIADCSVAAIFERLRSEFAGLAQAKGLEFVVESSDAVVRSDPALLAQIVQNLVANAIRYTKAGWVQLRCLASAASVRIEVLDTGVGIPACEVELIFEEFYQLPREPGERREGLGLGLSIVRRIADLLGHRLAVESTVGTGSCFSLSVPRVESLSVDRAAAAPRPHMAKGASGRILVMDDDASVARATAVLLRSEGYDVAVASHTEQARSRLSGDEPAPDLLVCDYHLGPNETGIDAIRAIRAILQRPLPAILVTGDTSSEASKAAYDIGDCRLLSKPVDTDEMLGLIASVVERTPRVGQPERIG